MLRDMAKTIKEASELPIQEERKRLWKCCNELKPERAMVLANPQNGFIELVPLDSLVCKDEFVKWLEFGLRLAVYRIRHLHDDVPIGSRWDVPVMIEKGDYGFENKVTNPDYARGAYHIEPVIKNMDDLAKLHPAKLYVDWEKTEANFNFVSELFGDILDVRKTGMNYCRCGLTRVLIHLRGLDLMMYDMYDEPELLHALMAFLRDQQIREYEFYEKEKVLDYNTTPYSGLGSGGYSYNGELEVDEAKPATMSTMMVWGESQETVGVGPKQFEEYVLNYQLPILNRFGMVDYGCCEGLDQKFDLLIEKIPKLRWVAVSPWCDREAAMEKLAGKYVYAYKPNPTPLTSRVPDFEFAERQIRETLAITKGCATHIVMKDTSTFMNEPRRIEKWIEIAMKAVKEA